MEPVTIQGLRQMLAQGQYSVVDHVQAVLTAIHDIDPVLHAYVAVAEETAMREAEAADDRIRTLGPAAWRERPLLGVTISVKDLIQTADLPTTRGSLLDNHRRRVDAPAVARLRAAGAIVVGKTTTSEYGWSASTVSRVAATTRNPWSPEHSPGGSSGGAAAAVSAGLCDVALGTDGAGSIRIPAAFCGVVGYKPSFGRVPYVPPGPERLAHLGPIARNVADVITLAPLLAGAHPDDPDSATAATRPPGDPDRLSIGWIEFPGTSAEVRAVSEQAWSVLRAHRHAVERLAAPLPDPYEALVTILAATEAAGTAPADEERADQARMAIVRHGRGLSGAEVMRAEEARLALRRTLLSVMDEYDLLAMATVPIEPFGVDAIAPPWAADPGDLRWLSWAPATYPFNLTGQPAISLPVGLTSAGLPVGLQLVGPNGGDDLVLAMARQIEADLAPMPVPLRVMKGWYSDVCPSMVSVQQPEQRWSA